MSSRTNNISQRIHSECMVEGALAAWFKQQTGTSWSCLKPTGGSVLHEQPDGSFRSEPADPVSTLALCLRGYQGDEPYQFLWQCYERMMEKVNAEAQEQSEALPTVDAKLLSEFLREAIREAGI